MNSTQEKQNGSTFDLDINLLLHALWKHATAMILCGVLFGALAFGYARLNVAPRYEASALFFVNNSSFNISTALQVQTGGRQAGVGNYLGILKARSTLEEIIERSGVSISYKRFRSMISAVALDNTDLIQITVNSENPETARLLANAIADVLPEKVSEISANTSLEIVDYAETPESRVSPNYITYAEMGFLAGAALVALIVCVVVYFDSVIRDTDYLEQTYQVPVIAEIPNLAAKGSARHGYGYYGEGAKAGKRRSPGKKESSPQLSSAEIKEARKAQSTLCDNISFAAAESYKRLRTNLMFSLPEKPCRIIGITSSLRGEGKSTTAINLSYSFAQSGKRVLLIDGDMRLPTIAPRLGLKREPGLSNLIVGMNKLDECLQISELYDNWFILTAGTVPPNPLELLGSERMHALLTSLEEHFDYIVLDLPPVDIVADALVASKWTDGMLNILRNGYTDRRALKGNMAQVKRLGVKLLGFVVTFSNLGDSTYKSYGKYGRYGKYAKSYGYGYGKQGGFTGTEEEKKKWEFLDAVKNDTSTRTDGQTGSFDPSRHG